MSLTLTNLKDYVFSKGVTVLGTATVTSSTGQVGALQIDGGAAIAKNMYVGSDSYVGGNSEIFKDLTVRQDIVAEGAVTAGTNSAGSVVPALYSNNLLLSTYVSLELTTLSEVILDTFSSDVYRTAKYEIQITSANKLHVTEIMLFHNNTTVFVNEYGTMFTHTSLGTFDAALVSTTVQLKFTPSSIDATTVKIVRIGITV